MDRIGFFLYVPTESPAGKKIIKAIPHRKKVPNTAECDIIKSWINR